MMVNGKMTSTITICHLTFNRHTPICFGMNLSVRKTSVHKKLKKRCRFSTIVSSRRDSTSCQTRRQKDP